MEVQDFIYSLRKQGLESFYGVPDSLLKSFCAFLTDNISSKSHIITANEGNAVAMACGYYLATGKIGVVYLQNSGLGNCINPLLSLSDEEVYNIPFLMIIGWRGEPGTKDEPQHIKQGKLTDELLKTMGLAYSILQKDIKSANETLEKAAAYMKETKKPYALLVQQGTFEEYKVQNKQVSGYHFIREEAIAGVLDFLPRDAAIISTTGHISRELYECREKQGKPHDQDFLTVGAMGHASSIALSIAIENPQRPIVCFDGDGACLMHMGALPVISSQDLPNYKHIIFNNEAHDSVGGQPTCADRVDFPKLALACGYKKAWSAQNLKELQLIMPELLAFQGPVLLEIKVKCGARKDLGRPKENPVENKALFIKFLE